jgi:PAS domain S-box-containing protein
MAKTTPATRDRQSGKSRRDTHAEQALRASEARFAAAFDSSPIPMAITTVAEGRYIAVNEAFERQVGYTRAEVYGRTSMEIAVWPSLKDRIAMITALLEQKTLRNRETRFRTKSGNLITTLYSASIIELDGQQCVLAAIEDITPQRQAEEALRESEAKFRLLAETAPCGIFIYRMDGSFCYVNPEVEVCTGYSAQELSSMSVWDLVHPEYRDLVRARGEARWRGENVPSRYEFKIITRDGQARWIDYVATRTEFGGETAVLGTTFDITANKRHEKQAKEHTAFLQTLVENSPFGILVGGPDHRVRFSNRAFQRMFLYSEDEVVGKDPDDLVGLPETAEAAKMSRKVLSGQSVHATTVRRRKDGSRIDVEVHAIPLLSGDTFVGCFGIYQDITERVESEAKLRALRGRLSRVQDEERAHIARELHDNTGQRLALLSLHLAELTRSARPSAPSLIEQLNAAKQLVDEISIDIHGLSRRLHPSQLNYIGLTRALSNLGLEFAQRSALEIEFDHDEIPDDLPADVTLCIYRVAQEAIRNAEKHSGASRVRVTLAAGSTSIRLCVSDSGRGFAPGSIEGSPGLGLVSMAERVRSMGGTLSIQSEVDRGTRIEVSIPIPQDVKMPARDATSANPPVAFVPRASKVHQAAMPEALDQPRTRANATKSRQRRSAFD